MNEVEEAQLFWRIVAKTLVRFYGFEDEAAEQRVRIVQGKMTARAIARDLTYHSQPLHIAAKIADVLKPISGDQLLEYDALVERLSRHDDRAEVSGGDQQKKRFANAKLQEPSGLAALAR